MQIIKNDGTKEEFNIDKITEKINFACKGLKNVSPSQIAMNTKIKIQDGTKSKDIQMALVKSAAELISSENPDYDIVASRLLNQRLRKEVYKQYTPLPFYDEIVKRVKKGYYDSIILEKYSKDEIEYFGTKIKYELDEDLNFLGMSQLYYKYLLEYKGSRVETPQEVYMIMNMYIFMNEKNRKELILSGYNLLSKRKVSFPTPIMNGLRTKFKKFISCNVMNSGDSKESLAILIQKILLATASKSGIGINGSLIRGLGADIDDGRMEHTGVLPIFKAFESAGAAFSQSKIRGGAININTPWYHYETELISQLKDTRGTDETRCRHTDQTIILNEFFLKKALNHEDVYLFHMNEVPKLYENLGSKNFEEIYNDYSKKVSKKHKKLVNAWDLFNLYIFERSLTGRIYFGFANNSFNGPWKNPVYNFNLCLEVQTPNTPLDGSQGIPEISSCILASINHGYVDDKEIPEICNYLVRFLDNMIDYMTYDMEEVEYSSKKRRTLGIGSSDLFHFLAKNKQFYNTKEGQELIFNRHELMYYYLLKTSNEIAKERGKCELFEESKYSDGWLAFQEKLNLFKIDLKQDWDILSKSIKKYGLRNSTLVAHAPCSNSASLSNSTNGVEPPRELVSQVEDKNFKVTKLVPEYLKFKNYYTTSWGQDFNNIDYFKLLGIIQLFTDQAISTNQYSNALIFSDKKLPIDLLIKEILTANKVGLKSLYYQNFLSVDNEDGLKESKSEGCGSGGCSV